MRKIEQCQAEFEQFDATVKKLYPWETVEKSLRYNKEYFWYLTIKYIAAQIPFYLSWVLFYGPAYLWNYYIGKFHNWGWCENGDGGYNI